MKTLRNKKTGEVITVDDIEAQSYLNPQSNSQLTQTSTSQDTTQGSSDIFKKMMLLDLVKTGGKNLSKLSTLNDIFKPTELSTAEAKNKSAYQGSLGLIDVLEENFTKAKGGEYTGLGAIVAGTKKNIAGKLNLDKPAGIYNREKSGFTANLKTITGDTGVMTQKDYERIESLLPKFTDDPEMAAQFFKDMRQIIANKFGGGITKSKYQQPEVKGGAMAALLPGLTELYQGKQQAVQEQGLGALPKQSLETLIPGLNLFEPGGTRAAGEVLAILGGVDALKSAKNFFTGGGPIGGAGRARTLAGAEAEAEGKVLQNKDILTKTVEKISVSKNLSATDKAKAIKMAQDNFGKGGTTAIQESISDFSKADAFTKGGTVVKGPKGLYNLSVRESLKELWLDEAPEVLKQTQVLSKLFKTQRSLLKTLGLVGSTTGGIGGGMYLWNLLRGNQQGGNR